LKTMIQWIAASAHGKKLHLYSYMPLGIDDEVISFVNSIKCNGNSTGNAHANEYIKN